MSESQWSWEEWIEQLAEDSGEKVDLRDLAEETAKVERPRLYEWYMGGDDPNDIIASTLLRYEDDIWIWLDPDDRSGEEWYAETILSNTQFFQTFTTAIADLRHLNKLVVKEESALKVLKQQIYVSAITCLETYLSDAFINTVLSDRAYIKQFLISFKSDAQKLSVKEIFDFVDQAEQQAKTRMLNVMYHNIALVQTMYQNTLAISLISSNPEL